MTEAMSRQPLETPLWITRPVLPPLGDYSRLLEDVWRSGIVTNLGPLHQELESQLAQRAGRGHLSLWNNGTSALLGMLSQCDLSGEVIVTPFTFPATVHAIAALGLEPVFADVEPDGFTLSVDAALAAVTTRTTAILGTHIYGQSCDTDGLSRVARDNGLTLLFDGAHSFAVSAPAFDDNPTVLGDATMLSFHATKLFHTVEGGAIVTPHETLDEKFRSARNFGITGEDVVRRVGLNGKMSELHAAMGLAVLPLIDAEMAKRRAVARHYVERLHGIDGIRIVSGLGPSRQYFVVEIDEGVFGARRDDVHARLRAFNVMSRRYFYPLCADIDAYASLESAKDLPVARRASQQVLALPLYGDLDVSLVDFVCDVILESRPAE